MGHRKGASRIEPLVSYAAKRGIEYVTFWAFSSENWNRGEKEVGFLMRVFREFLKGSVVKRMLEKGVRVKVIGDIESFPEDIVTGVGELVEKSKSNKRVTAVFALNYGGRREILRAVEQVLRVPRVSQVPRVPRVLDEEEFSSYLYTADLPDPDMVARTGGEMRLSGFMPWQSVYSELYFTDVLWPDFDEGEFEKVIEEFGRRERRFGK
jgi:undecaprenyl diphosphate synthase